MKKIFALVFVLFASLGIFAQEKTIRQSEFDTIFKNSFRWRSGQPYRETRTQESIFEVLPENDVSSDATKLMPPRKTLIKSISEHLPGVGYRLIVKFNSPSLNKRNETVVIGDKIYARDGDGEWTESIKPTAKPAASTAIKIRETVTVKTGIEIETEYKFLGSEIFDGQSVNIYAKIEKSKSVNTKNNRESYSVTTTKHFYAENGKLLKTEWNQEIRGDNSVGRFVSKTIYETDSNIKIEAPK